LSHERIPIRLDRRLHHTYQVKEKEEEAKALESQNALLKQKAGEAVLSEVKLANLIT
jgi:hypothetical protein